MTTIKMMPQKQQTCQSEFRAALALNNMAVSMMERSCCEQAFETLRDAAVMIRSSLGSSFESACTATTACKAAVDERKKLALQAKMEEANRRAANPIFSACPSSFPPLKVISDDAAFYVESCDAIISNASSSFSSTRIMIQISTDHSNFSSFDDCREADFYASIILFNLAIASLCKATNNNNGINSSSSTIRPMQATKLHRDASTILTLCRNLLGALICETMANDPIMTHRVSFVNFLVLQALVQTLTTTPTAHCRHVEHELITTVMQELDILRSWLNIDVSKVIFQARKVLASAA